MAAGASAAAAAAVPRTFLHHVVGDLTLGKPELVEFHDTETVESAARAIANHCTGSEAAIPVWRRTTTTTAASTTNNKNTSTGGGGIEGGGRDESYCHDRGRNDRASRFVGMVSSLDVVAFVARVGDHEKALRSPVSGLLSPNLSLLKEVDPATRLIDALEMMKQGVRFLLVRKSNVWKGFSKRFSVLYYGKWLRNIEASSMANTSKSSQPSSSLQGNDKYCCLSREDVLRFIIGCLGSLAPIPLSPICVLGAITPYYSAIEASSLAIEAAQQNPQDPSAVAVVEANPDGTRKIIGEISAYKLWKCDHLAAAWAMANLSAGQFVMGAEDSNASPKDVPDFSMAPQFEEITSGTKLRPRKFSSRSMGFYSKPACIIAIGGLRSMYRGRSAPLTCKSTSSLAAVMAQMLSHRATHVWVTEEGSDDILLGVVSYTDILHAVTKSPSTINVVVPCEQPCE